MISILICTYNRSSLLDQALSDLAGITPPGQPVEIIVVDNNSTDDTKKVALRHKESCPFPLRYVLEKEQGLSHARNRGIHEAQGDWIVFTDDDVRIEEDWLAALMRELDTSGASAAGGRVVPIWPAEVPGWVAKEGPFVQSGMFLNYDLENSRWITLDDPEPFGCNMAFRADLFRRHGLFRTDLGRVGGRLISGEDTEMFSRMLAAGEKVRYVADAAIHHPVEEKRLSLKYLIQWKFWGGYGNARMEEAKARRSIVGIPLYTLNRLFVGSAGCITSLLRGNRPAAIHHLGRVCSEIGCIWWIWSGQKASKRRNAMKNEPAQGAT